MPGESIRDNPSLYALCKTCPWVYKETNSALFKRPSVSVALRALVIIRSGSDSSDSPSSSAEFMEDFGTVGSTET